MAFHHIDHKSCNEYEIPLPPIYISSPFKGIIIQHRKKFKSLPLKNVLDLSNYFDFKKK